MLTTSKIFFLLLTSCGLCVSLAQQADPELLILEQRAKDSLFYGATNTSLRYYQTILKSNAATPADQLKACIGLASTFLKMEQLDSAMVYNSRANKLFNDIKSADVFYEARILDNYGWFTFRSLGKNSQYNKASEYFNKALDLKKKSKLTTDVDLARSYLNLSIIQTDINEFESSRLFLKQAEDLLNCQDPRCKILNASIHREYGTLLWLEGQPDAALIEFNESLLLALEVFDQENTYFANLYNLMSLLYMEQQRIYQAIDYLNKGLAVNIAEYGLDQHFMQIVIHNNLGEAYYLVGDEEKALFHTNKTLKMGLQAFGPGFSELFYPYSQLGQIYGDARGLPFLTKALQLAKTAGDKTRLSTINGYLAMVYFRLENYDKALSFAQESLRYREAIVKTNSIKLINDHELIAKIYLELGDLDKSLYHNSLSLAMNAAGNQELEYTELSSISMEDCLDQETLILAFNQRSNILYELYKNSGLEENLKNSLLFSQRCVDALEQFDFNFQNLLDEQVFNNLVKEFYSHHVKLVLQNKDSISDIKRRELAFLYSEKSRAQLLGKLIKRTQLLNEFDSTNSLMSEDAALKNKLSNLINQRLEELQKEKIDSSELYRINGKIADVKISLASIENSFKELKDLDLESDRLMPQPIETIRASLMPYQSIIKFFKLKDRLLVFLISQQDSEFFDLNDKHLESKINTINEAIQSKDYETFLSSSNAVYEQLLKPIEHHIQGTELIIIPDEYLWNLNFGLLIKQSTEFTSTPKYLLYDYAISYANSASIFYNYTEHRDEVDKTETLGFAYTPVSIADGMDSVRPINQQTALPGTETELRALSEFLKGDFYFRNPSNESTFKKEASNYGLIHLALHAEADSLKSNDLKILFSGQQKTNEEDNILYGHEIYNMRLNANMVVLSACNSGIGKIDNGEGVQSLGNAFQHAGTQSLVLTKWNISDKSTPTLIENFYKHLKTGKSKSKALQEAKIDFLSSASVLELNPYYWGSFYVLGDPSAITVATKNAFKTRYLFMLFFLVIIFLVFFNSFKR